MLWFIALVLVVGIVIGAIARLLVPGPDPMGVVATWAIGVGGSFVGGLLGYLLFDEDVEDGAFQLSGLLGSLAGAIVLVLLVRLLRGRDRAASSSS